jgi:flagellar biosynthetic protein FliR
MNPLKLPIEQFEVFVLVLIRTMAIVMSLPAFGSKTVPTIVKAGLCMAISMLIFPTIVFNGFSLPHETLSLMLIILREIGIGLLIGYLAHLVFAGIHVGGQMIGYQMGFGVVNVLDPQSNSQLSIIAVFQNLMAMLLFLALNVHHILIQSIADSFQLIPLAAGQYPLAIMGQLVEAAGELFLVAIKIGAPMMAVLLFTNVSMGVIAKTVPQMNVFIVAFPLQIGVGLIMLGLSLPMTMKLFQGIFHSLEGQIGTLLHLIRVG